VSIQTDCDYQVAVEALSKKNNPTCNIEFLLVALEGWRIRKPVCVHLQLPENLSDEILDLHQSSSNPISQ
jgi:hypothetical protein